MTLVVKLPSGKHVTLTRAAILIGSDPTCDICLPASGGIQPQHARLRKMGNRWLVESQGDWPIQVGNGKPEKTSWLAPGDVVHIGSPQLTLVFEPAPNSSSDPPSATPVSAVAPKPSPLPSAGPWSQPVAPAPRNAISAPAASSPTGAVGNQPSSSVPLPRPAEMSTWHYAHGGKQSGPVSQTQLRQLAARGEIFPDDLVWREGMPGWVTAQSLPGLLPTKSVLKLHPLPTRMASPSPTPGTVLQPLQPTPTGMPALWNPAAAGAWSIVLSCCFGAFLLSKNWSALGEPQRAARAMYWFYGVLAYLAINLLANGNLGALAVPIMLVWFFHECRPQMRYLAEHFRGQYARMPWGKPIGIGAVAVLGYLCLGGLSNPSDIDESATQPQQVSSISDDPRTATPANVPPDDEKPTDLGGDPSVDFSTLDFAGIDYDVGPQGQRVEVRDTSIVEDNGDIIPKTTMAYRGSDGNYYKHGSEAITLPNRPPIKVYEESFAYGRLHGKRIIWNKNGTKFSETEYFNGTNHGKWMLYIDGRLSSEGNYRHGRQHGPTVAYREDGMTSVTEYLDGRRVSFRFCSREGTDEFERYSEFYPSGKDKLEGRYKNGQKDGTWTSYAEDGAVLSVQEFKNGDRLR